MSLFGKQPILLTRDLAEDGKVFWHLADEKLHTIEPFLEHIIELVDFGNRARKPLKSALMTQVKTRLTKNAIISNALLNNMPLNYSQFSLSMREARIEEAQW